MAYDIKRRLNNAWKIYHAKDYERALKKFAQIIQLDPNNANAYAGLSSCYLTLGFIKSKIVFRTSH